MTQIELEQLVDKFFDAFDKDNDGTISKHEMGQIKLKAFLIKKDPKEYIKLVLSLELERLTDKEFQTLQS